MILTAIVVLILLQQLCPRISAAHTVLFGVKVQDVAFDGSSVGTRVRQIGAVVRPEMTISIQFTLALVCLS